MIPRITNTDYAECCPKILSNDVCSQLDVSVLLAGSATRIHRFSFSCPQTLHWSIGVPVRRQSASCSRNNQNFQNCTSSLCRSPCHAHLCVCVLEVILVLPGLLAHLAQDCPSILVVRSQHLRCATVCQHTCICQCRKFLVTLHLC